MSDGRVVPFVDRAEPISERRLRKLERIWARDPYVRRCAMSDDGGRCAKALDHLGPHQTRTVDGYHDMRRCSWNDGRFTYIAGPAGWIPIGGAAERVK